MLEDFKQWRDARRIDALGVTQADWQLALGDWAVYLRYAPAEQQRLQQLALHLLLHKRLHGVGELQLTDSMRLRIAGMAVVPVLNLGLEWYDRWKTILVYDGPFVAEHQWRDEFGVVHAQRRALSGETRQSGPVVLSWQDVEQAGGARAANVVLHELAHTLDMRWDGANGAPPLHADMDPLLWKSEFTSAWEHLQALYQRGAPLPVDDYALEDPAEFFAVLSETFFEKPRRLLDGLPGVYRQLQAFYRQNPLGTA
ncbi:MAG: zinc-dependent peptidase [Halopseudomonas sp.]